MPIKCSNVNRVKEYTIYCGAANACFSVARFLVVFQLCCTNLDEINLHASSGIGLNTNKAEPNCGCTSTSLRCGAVTILRDEPQGFCFNFGPLPMWPYVPLFIYKGSHTHLDIKPKTFSLTFPLWWKLRGSDLVCS